MTWKPKEAKCSNEKGLVSTEKCCGDIEDSKGRGKSFQCDDREISGDPCKRDSDQAESADFKGQKPLQEVCVNHFKIHVEGKEKSKRAAGKTCWVERSSEGLGVGGWGGGIGARLVYGQSSSRGQRWMKPERGG